MYLGCAFFDVFFPGKICILPLYIKKKCKLIGLEQNEKLYKKKNEMRMRKKLVRID